MATAHFHARMVPRAILKPCDLPAERWREYANGVLGTPYLDHGRSRAGWDCWGLIVCAYRDVCGIILPSYDEITWRHHRQAIRAMANEIVRWQSVQAGEEIAGDVLLLRPCHTCLIIGDGLALHAIPGANTSVIRYGASLWACRIMGIYRYVG